MQQLVYAMSKKELSAEETISKMVPGMATRDYNPNAWKAEMGIVSFRIAWAAYQGSVSKSGG